MLAAERKSAMADLARGVSHDVNNALGAVLPLVQQMRADLEDGTFRPDELVQDLGEIENSLLLCRRVFGGMLRVARGSMRHVGDVLLPRAVETTLDILRDSIERKGILLAIDFGLDLPAIRGVHGDVEQLLLNLLSNARDATSSGGRILVRARRSEDRVLLEVVDTGCGIPKKDIHKVLLPFFTTKPDGNGLGLSICRSIVSQMGADMEIASTPREGTTVAVRFCPVREKVHGE
jgi:signal transduction histidine kinase